MFLLYVLVCTCVVHKRCHEQVVTVCPRMKKTQNEQVSAALRSSLLSSLSQHKNQTSCISFGGAFIHALNLALDFIELSLRAEVLSNKVN